MTLLRVEIQFAYSAWWLLPILVVAAILTRYFYPPKKNIEDRNTLIFLQLKRVFRFLGLATIMALLLGPTLKSHTQHTLLPQLPVFLDISESMLATDSQTTRAIEQKIASLQKELEGIYEVTHYYLGDRIHNTWEGFTEKKTRLSAVGAYLNKHYTRTHTGAYVVVTDGIYNAGMSPLFEPINVAAPLFVVGMGDTSQRKDVSIVDVNFNSLVYLNNDFNIVASLHAVGYTGKTIQLTLKKGNEVLAQQRHTLSSGNEFKTLELITQASQPGYNRYTLEVTQLEGEVTYENNKRDIYIEVIDGREQIALVYLSPHPDINAIQGALSQNKNLEVTLYSYQELEKKPLQDVGLIICHQLPGTEFPQSLQWIEKQVENHTPLWIWVGPQTQLINLNRVFKNVRIQQRNPEWNDAQLNINSQFKPFSMSEQWIENVEKWPPLKTPFAQYQFSGLDILAYQKINQIATQYPLIAYYIQDQTRQAWVLGEGVWKWNMHDKRQNGTSLHFNEWVWKTARYLMVKEDKRPFKVYPSQETYDESESVEIIAEVYDANYDPLPNAHIEVELISEDQKTLNYTLHKRGNIYVAKPGILSPGTYQYKAQSKSHPHLGSQEGMFIVKPLNLEYQNLQANHTLLKTWAQNQDGTFYTPNQWEQMVTELKNNETLYAGLIQTRTQKQFLNDLLIFLLIITTLFSLEWLLRKWEGGY